MLSACDINGFIPEACELVERERSADDDDPDRGTIDKDRFVRWLDERLVDLLGDYSLGEPRSVVVLDNASIHHDDEIVDLIESTGARVLFTAPYSPELNPIEYMFGKYKKMLQRFVYDHDMATSHLMALHSITPRDARAYFRHCGVPGCENFPRTRVVDGLRVPVDDSSTEIACALAACTSAIATVAAIVAVKKGKKNKYS